MAQAGRTFEQGPLFGDGGPGSLLPQELVQRFAALGSQEGKPDPLVVCRYYVPFHAAEWYMLDYNPAERLFFGWANLLGEDMYWELGSVGLDEMEDLAITVTPARVGLPLTEKQYTCRVTLDRNFIETPISRIRELPPRCAQLHASAAAGL